MLSPHAAVRALTGRRPQAGAQMIGAAAVAGAVSVGYQFAYRRIDFPLPSQVSTVVASLVAIAVVACAAVVVLAGRRWRADPVAVCGWILPALLSTAVQSRLLTGTRFYMNGLGGDQQFRTAFLTRMTDSPALSDAVYPGLPPYYSPAWFWVGGRFAHAAGIPGWEFYKIWAIVTLAVAASLAYVLWARVVRPRHALILAVVTALVGLHTGAYSPYSWVLIAVAPPLAVLTLRTVRRILRDGRREVWPCVGIGVYVGLASITHALLAGVAALYLVVAVGAVAWGWRIRRRIVRLVPSVLISIVSALPFVAVVWGPYLLADAPLGTDSAAAVFLPDIGAHVPAPFFEATVIGVMCAAGLAWAVLRSRRHPVAAALCALLATAFLWYVLSFLATSFSTTLLAFRLEPLVVLALACGGVFGVRDAAALLRRRGRAGPHGGERAQAITAVVAAFAVFGALHVAYETSSVEPDWDDAARNTADPDGVVARGTELQRAAPGPTADGIRDAISAAAGGRADDELVLLSNVHTLSAFYPYRGFQTVTAAYANPKAGFASRNDLIRSWAHAQDGADLMRMLEASPVRPPDVLVLRRAPEGWIYDLAVSQLPREPADTSEPAVFDPRVFDGDHFVTQRVGTLEVVAVRR